MGQLFNQVIGSALADQRSRARVQEERAFRKQQIQDERDFQQQRNEASGIAGYLNQGQFSFDQPVGPGALPPGGIGPVQETEVGFPIFNQQLLENPRAASIYEQAVDRLNPQFKAPATTTPVRTDMLPEEMQGMFSVDPNTGMTYVPNSIVGELFPDEPDAPGAPTGTVPVIIPPDREDLLSAFPAGQDGVSFVPTSIATSIFAEDDEAGVDSFGTVDPKRLADIFDRAYPPSKLARIGFGSAIDASGDARSLFEMSIMSGEGSLPERIETAHDVVQSQYPNLMAERGDIAHRGGRGDGEFRLGTPKSFKFDKVKNIVKMGWKKSKSYKATPEGIEKMLVESGELGLENAIKFTNLFPTLVKGEEFAFVRTYITQAGELRKKETPEPGDMEVPDTEEVITAQEAVESLKEVQDDKISGALDDLF